MSKTLMLAAIALAGVAPLSVEACRDMVPDLSDLKSYESIFVGEVSGIRLIGYENKQLGRPDACEIQDNGEQGECFNLIGGNAPVAIFAIPTKVIKGKILGVQELQQAGCNYSNIPLKEHGIFFVNPGGSSAVIVWRSKASDYMLLLERLGVIRDDR